MAEIKLLDSNTIDKIAAGEVVERPSSVVKELVENAMDAGADAITVEIRDGGCSFIRVTDNGAGIEKDQVRKAFFRHATSKISSAEDLFHIRSLGFRGEALSSIAAVSMVELVTKPEKQLTGTRYCLEGDREKEFSEVGAPDGTTIIVRELFFNTPVRKKFLKAPATEGSYISDLMEHMALSRPEVAFQFMINGTVKFHTSGNGDLKEIIYRIYGREVARELIPFHAEGDEAVLDGFLGSPVVVRANRNFEFFFVNGRYIRSPLLSKGLEAGYKAYLMQHRFPFALMHVKMDPENIDVNVHPSKMEVRFHDQPGLYAFLEEQVRLAMRSRELIPQVTLEEKKPARPSAPEQMQPQIQPQPAKPSTEQMKPQVQPQPARPSAPEQMKPQTQPQPAKPSAPEQMKLQTQPQLAKPSVPEQMKPQVQPQMPQQTLPLGKAPEPERHLSPEPSLEPSPQPSQAPKEPRPRPEAPQPFETNRRKQLLKEEEAVYQAGEAKQLELFDGKLLSKEAAKSYHILGQVFETYWLVEYEDRILFVDQHAAHEKVKFEALVEKLRNGKVNSQMLVPPMVMALSAREAATLQEYGDYFEKMGFEIEDFGGNAVTVRGVPTDLYGHYEKDFLLGILDELEDEPPHGTPSIIEEKLASMACKSAVKGNHRMSEKEMEALLDQLLTLDNPYHCPHGRPTIITMTKYELEKKFKRIV